MTLEEAIKDIRESGINLGAGDYVDPETLEIAEKAMLNVANKWISVDERLPETDEPVLVWYEYFRYGRYNRMYQTYGIAQFLSETRKWWIEGCNTSTDKVLYWRPLPPPMKIEEEPPEEDDEEEDLEALLTESPDTTDAQEDSPAILISIGFDEYYGEWFKCPACGYSDIMGSANYCPSCGVKVKIGS